MRSDPTVAAALKGFTAARQEQATQRAKIEQAQVAAMRLRFKSGVMKARADFAANQARQLVQDTEKHAQTLYEIAAKFAKAAEQPQEKPGDVSDF